MKILFSTMDSNKGLIIILDNQIDDNEWSRFYDLYIEPF